MDRALQALSALRKDPSTGTPGLMSGLPPLPSLMPGLPPLPGLMPGLGKAAPAFPPEAPQLAAAPELPPKAAPAAPAKASTAASATTMLAAIRDGIAKNDRAAVRAGVEAIVKAGVVLEPHVQQMLKQWLPGGGPEETSSEGAPKEPTAPVSQPSGKSALTANLLATIRAGIAKEDRAGVRAAVEAAKKQGVVLESHIQQMLDRWLPVPTDSDPPAKPSTASQPAQHAALPQQPVPAAAPTEEAKPAASSSAASQPILALIRVGIANEDRAAVRSAVSAAAAGGIVLEPHVQDMLKKWLGADQPDAGLAAPEATSTPAVASIPAAGLPIGAAQLAVPGLVGGMPSFFPTASVLPQIPGQFPGALLPGSALPPAIGSTAAPALLTPLEPALGLLNTDPTQVATSAGAVVAATPPVPTPAAPVKPKIPSLPPRSGAGISIFKKPVLKKDEDLDKAMEDFFSEVSGIDISEEPAPGVEEPAPSADEPMPPAEDDKQPAPSEAPEKDAPAPAVDPAPIATPVAAPAPDGIQAVANDGSFMAMFLAGLAEESVPKPPATPAVAASEPEPPKAEKESAPKPKRSLKEIQEARKAARKREASPPPPAREKTSEPPPPAEPLQPGLRPIPPVEKAPPPPAKDEPMLWPGELTVQEEDEKKAKKAPEAWEYIKKDEFGAGNFFSFDSF